MFAGERKITLKIQRMWWNLGTPFPRNPTSKSARILYKSFDIFHPKSVVENTTSLPRPHSRAKLFCI